MSATALILAGGRATRFGGIAKHALVVDGATILERQRAVLGPRVAEVLISGALDVPGLRTVHDVVVGVGPLAGIWWICCWRGRARGMGAWLRRMRWG